MQRGRLINVCFELPLTQQERTLTWVNALAGGIFYKGGLVRGMTRETPTLEFRRQLRSLFAVLRAIIRSSAAGEHSKDEFAARLEGRIGALARVHDMLMRAPDDGIDLEELVRGELLAQCIPDANYRAAGPDTRIGIEAATAIALAFHEMTTNAVLHGAFVAGEGQLDVEWDHVVQDGRNWLRLRWEETGAQFRGIAPTTKGFGLELLERTLPYELDACTQIDWADAGARIQILVPARASATLWRAGERAVAV